MVLTRDFKQTMQARVERDPVFRTTATRTALPDGSNGGATSTTSPPTRADLYSRSVPFIRPSRSRTLWPRTVYND